MCSRLGCQPEKGWFHHLEGRSVSPKRTYHNLVNQQMTPRMNKSKKDVFLELKRSLSSEDHKEGVFQANLADA